MADAVSGTSASEKLRVDKWLWRARFFKTRGRAAEVAGSGRLRVNGEHVTKPSHPIRPGDVLTFAKADRIRVIRVEALGHRRGPAPEAQALYTDLDERPPQGPRAEPDVDKPGVTGERPSGSGRPTKRQRREIDALRGHDP